MGTCVAGREIWSEVCDLRGSFCYCTSRSNCFFWGSLIRSTVFENVESSCVPVLQGVRSGLKSVMTTLKSPTIIQKIFTDRVCTGDNDD